MAGRTGRDKNYSRWAPRRRFDPLSSFMGPDRFLTFSRRQHDFRSRSRQARKQMFRDLARDADQFAHGLLTLKASKLPRDVVAAPSNVNVWARPGSWALIVCRHDSSLRPAIEGMDRVVAAFCTLVPRPMWDSNRRL